MVLRAFAIFALCSGFAVAAGAQTAVKSDQIDCETAENQNDLTQCAQMDFEEADSDLNDAYQAAMAAMKDVDANLDKADQGAADALKQAQRAWITFRDETCAAEAWTMHGGSAEPMVLMGCKARVTSARAEDLWTMSEGN